MKPLRIGLIGESTLPEGFLAIPLAEDARLATDLLMLGPSLDAVFVTTADVPDILRHLLLPVVTTPEQLAEVTPRESDGRWYLPVEKAFQLRGRGLVVTGTVARGTVRLNDVAVLEPGKVEIHVRGINVGGDPVESADQGVRASFNLQGASLEATKPGQFLAEPGAVVVARNIEARLTHQEVPFEQRVRVFVGSDSAQGRVHPHDTNPDLVRIHLEAPLAIALDLPLLLREDRGEAWLGGGAVAAIQNTGRKHKVRAEPISPEQLEAAILEVVGEDPRGVSTQEISQRVGRSIQELGTPLEELRTSERLLSFAGLWFSPAGFEEGTRKFVDALRHAHARQPAQSGVPRERIVHVAGLTWAGKPLDRIMGTLVATKVVVQTAAGVRLPDFHPKLTARRQDFLDRVIVELEKALIDVPGPHDLARLLAVPPKATTEILKVGADAGALIELADGIYYTPRQMKAIKKKVREITQGRPFGAGELREMLGTTRKYIIPLLEYFDETRFTRPHGENRVVRS